MISLKKYLKQVENSVLTLVDLELVIDLTNYSKEDYTFHKEENFIWFKSIVGKVTVENGNSQISFDLILDYPINIMIHEILEDSDKILRLHYGANSTLLETSLESFEMTKQIQYLERLLGGRELFKDVDHLFRRIWEIYRPISAMDMVHLEVLLSNCLRDKVNPHLPARMGKVWDPVTMNIKNVVFNSGFINSLSFENINKAIETGVISEDDLPRSILERVMTGEVA